MTRFLVAILLAATACSKPADGPGAQSAPASSLTAAAADPLTGKVWVLTTDDGRPGVMRVFLPDGVLIQDSCWETYRLSAWRRDGPRRIVWNEDGTEIAAEVDEASATALSLRLLLRGEEKSETYRVADAPFVCPDLPR